VQGGIFRAIMSRALFKMSNKESMRLQEQGCSLQKCKREPAPKETLKEANTIIPEADVLWQNVEAVLSYIYAKDAEVDSWQEAAGVKGWLMISQDKAECCPWSR
jgi:hypothetical protein